VEGLLVDVDGNSVEVTITATADVEYTYFRLEGPRLVLDLHNAEDRLGFSRRSVEAGGVAQVRAAPFRDEMRDVTRVVFDLEEGTRYSVVEDAPGRIRVRFENAGTRTTPRSLAALAEDTRPVAVDDPAGVALESLSEAEPVQLASLVVTPPRPPAGLFARETIREEAVPEEAAVRAAPAPPAQLSGTSPVADPGLFPEPNLAEIAGPAGPAAPLLSAQFVSPIPTPEYTGEIYSFDFRQLPLVDFFRTISEISGLNVILDPNIPSQSLTMALRDVPWDQALDIVLRSYNLAWELDGNVLRIALQSTLQAEEERRLEYRVLQEENGPLVTNTYILSYTQAETAAPLLEGLLTSRGYVVPVQGRNSVMVTDIETRFEAIENLIDFLDTPAQQVEIVARLLQANKTFRRDLGNQLGVIFNNNGSNVLTGVPTLPSPFVRNPPPSATAGGTGALPLVADFGIAAPTAGLSLLLGVGGDVLLDDIIQIAETRGTARLLSRPNVVVQNNEAAIIEQGTQIPVQTNVNNTISTQFQQFALRLEVTPQITEEGTILLATVIENSTPDFSLQVDGIPSIATQRAQTRVLIGDGETAYVGGILVDSDSVNVSQIPGLGNIPIIGNLFKSTSTVKATSELLFFVTARIKPAQPLSFLPGSAAGVSPDLESLFAEEPPMGILREELEIAGPGVD
jgi:type IV pilus assembly protein PilQ